MTCAPVKTTCPYCGVGCGILARSQADGSVAIEGDPDHPANLGRLCSKGAALAETLSLDDRLLFPLVQGRRVNWEAALDLVARRFSETIAEHGPDSVAFYVSGQILTEDYYVANKLMKGFIGSANIDTNSRLCMASSVAGHKRAFGSDTVPGTYEDLELADLVVLVGSNLAWCHPVLFQRIAAAREARGTKIVVVDPRATATCEIADLHLPIAPGSDVALFNGLLAHVAECGRLDNTFVEAHTSGLGQALKAATAMPRDRVEAVTGLNGTAIVRFYELFAATERAVTVYSQGVNQSSAGTDKVNAIINCHLATGRIGRPGMGPFSVTGQPNAMGGREVGGLANMLAAHMDLGDPEHRRIVKSFWGAPRIAERPGLKAVDLFRAVGDGRVKALWIMATNPVDSLPDADSVRDAIARCPFVVVSDVTAHTDTTELAHVILPAAAWGEKDGTVTNSERRISRQRPFLQAPGEARPDWWHICEVAKRMGFAAAFGYTDPAEIFAEHAALSGSENSGARDFDISAYAGIRDAEYDAMRPFQWPRRSSEPISESRFFADGGFFTPDRRARFIPTPFRAPAKPTGSTYPLALNTGRIRDQWHTMTRTAKAVRLLSHIPEPFLELHPQDASALGIEDGGITEVISESGRGLYRASVTSAQQPGSVFAPMHWTGQLSSLSRTDALVNAETDPVSGQPELKHTPVSVRPFRAVWHGVLLTLQRPSLTLGDYTVIVPQRVGFIAEIASSRAPQEWDAFARSLMATPHDDVEMLAYHDRATGQHRFAAFAGETLIALLFSARAPLQILRGWVAGQLGTPVRGSERLRLLAGRPGMDVPDAGPIVCACLQVGRNTIVDAVIRGGCITVAAVAEAVKAGTSCGSCRPEIGRIIHACHLEKAG
jgi:assimilatory nitrate reductase catalytic subunit